MQNHYSLGKKILNEYLYHTLQLKGSDLKQFFLEIINHFRSGPREEQSI